MRLACSSAALERLLDGHLEAAAAARLDLHLAACETCAAELRWLHHERVLFAQRRQGENALPPGFFKAVLARSAARRPPAPDWGWRKHWGDLASAALCAALLVALTVGARPTGAPPEQASAPCRSELGPELESNADNAHVCVSEPRSPSFWASVATVPVSRMPP